MNTMPSALVIAPHGMDEVLGCGGTMAGLAAAGYDVHTLVLFGDGSGRDAQRRLAGQAAASVLGTNAPSYSGFPENRGDTVPLAEVISAVERLIARLRPTEIFVPHMGNLHIDHQIAHRAGLTAARPIPSLSVQSIFAYETLSSTDWSPSDLPFIPTRFVDISATLNKKLDALQRYSAEVRDPPHTRSFEGIHTLAKFRGYSMGLNAAEAFMVLRQIVPR